MNSSDKRKKVTLICSGLTKEEHIRLESEFSRTIGTYLEAKGINNEQIKKESD